VHREEIIDTTVPLPDGARALETVEYILSRLLIYIYIYIYIYQ